MVSDSLPGDNSTYTGSVSDHRSTSRFPYAEIFYKYFPYYLSIGMTDTQYWESDSTLVKYYREAQELRDERVNQQAWLQGMYVYDALARISPIFQAFSKKGTKPQPYTPEPYALSNREIEQKKEKEEKAKSNKMKAFMEAYMVQTNKRFEEKKKEGEVNANNN